MLCAQDDKDWLEAALLGRDRIPPEHLSPWLLLIELNPLMMRLKSLTLSELQCRIHDSIDDSLFIVHSGDTTANPVFCIRFTRDASTLTSSKKGSKAAKGVASAPKRRGSAKKELTIDGVAVAEEGDNEQLAASTQDIDSLKALEELLLHSFVSHWPCTDAVPLASIGLPISAHWCRPCEE